MFSIRSQAGSANLSNLNPASHLLLSLREQDSMARNSSLSSVPKVSRTFCNLMCVLLSNCHNLLLLGDVVTLWVQRRTSDQEVAGSTASQALLCNNLRAVVHTLVPVTKQYELVILM